MNINIICSFGVILVFSNAAQGAAPVCSRRLYVAVIYEETTENNVLKIEATDTDGDDVRFSLLQKDARFGIDADTGQLSIISPLDREDNPSPFIHVIARDTGPDEEEAVCSVLIRLIDINDNSPQFYHQVAELTLRTSDTYRGRTLYIADAADPDVGRSAQVYYRLTTQQSAFSIDVGSGILSLSRALGEGDYEVGIVAIDGGVPPQAGAMRFILHVLPDSSGVTPSLEYQTLFTTTTKPQYSPRGPRRGMGTITKEPAASTPKSTPTLPFFTSTTPSSPKTALPKCLGNPLILTIIEGQTYLSYIQVFTSYGIINDGLIYTISGPTDLFSINSTTGVLSISKPLDSTSYRTYTLTIGVSFSENLSQSRTCNVKVVVTQPEIEPPAFKDGLTSDHVDVLEDQNQQGSVIYIVTAYDIGEHGEYYTVTYRLLNGNKQFTINNSTGQVILLDKLFPGTYNITIAAINSANPPQAANLELQIRVRSETVREDRTKSPPHIIVILADDLGFNDVGYNNDQVLTPNMDKLARSGIILNNNYAQASCTPSRAAFLTARYPYTVGMQHGILAPMNPRCSPTNVPLISDKLQEAGYQTHLIGKWHMGFCKNACMPLERGFNTFYGMYNGLGDYYSHRLQGGYDWRDGTEVDATAVGKYTTDLIRDRTVSIIDGYRAGDKPMFLFVPVTTPHVPLQAPQEYMDLYPNIPEPRKSYLAMVSSLDQAIGAIADKMKTKGLWENTFFLFSSDNGAESGRYGSNLPLRGAKGSLFEGAYRVPGFVAAPFLKGKGDIIDDMVHITDWGPTFLALAGADLEGTGFTGLDQTGLLLRGEPGPRSELIYNIDMEWSGQYFFGNVGYRRGDWKMIWGFPGLTDGYGENTKDFYHNDDYLRLINLTDADYTDIPEEPEWEYYRSPQELANMNAIVKLFSIDGITDEEMEAGRGPVMLFNLKDDPEERYDLSTLEEHSERIYQMKKTIMDKLKKEYVPVDPVSFAAWGREANPQQHPPLGAWTGGWCENLDMDIDLA